MEIPLNAQVDCTDGVYGRSVYVLINPVINQVTHLVVKEDSSPNTEYIVPVDVVSETIADTIRLRCSKAELEKMVRLSKRPLSKRRYPTITYLMVADMGMEWVHTTTGPILALKGL